MSDAAINFAGPRTQVHHEHAKIAVCESLTDDGTTLRSVQTLRRCSHVWLELSVQQTQALETKLSQSHQTKLSFSGTARTFTAREARVRDEGTKLALPYHLIDEG